MLFKDRTLIKRLERWWILTHMEAAQSRARRTWEQVMEDGAHLSDIRSDYRLLQALEHLGIAQLCDGQYRDASDALVQDIYRKCRRSKPLQTALGRAPGKLSPLDWVGRLCRIVGITSQGEVKPHGQRGGESSDRWYQHQSPEGNEVCRVILQCLERGLEKHLQLETDETVIDSLSGADHLQLEMNPNTALGDPPEALCF